MTFGDDEENIVPFPVRKSETQAIAGDMPEIADPVAPKPKKTKKPSKRKPPAKPRSEDDPASPEEKSKGTQGRYRMRSGSGTSDPNNIRSCEMRFAECYMRGMSYIDAYTETHETSELTRGEIGQRANRLMNSDRVQIYLQKIRSNSTPGVHINITPSVNDTAPIIELHRAMSSLNDDDILVTQNTLLKELHFAYLYSMAAGDFKAAIQAVEKKAAITGHLVDRKQVMVANLETMSLSDVQQAKEQCQRELMELGYDPKTGEFG